MTQTSNRFFDEVARLMNDAAGVAGGVRREFDTMMRTQAERILRDLDVVQREEFEAVKEMARLAREENEALKARVAALEAKLGAGGAVRRRDRCDRQHQRQRLDPDLCHRVASRIRVPTRIRLSEGRCREVRRRAESDDVQPRFLRWRIPFSENRYPLFRDMR
jgi:BMFP domain-containing protein YqiC